MALLKFEIFNFLPAVRHSLVSKVDSSLADNILKF